MMPVPCRRPVAIFGFDDRISRVGFVEFTFSVPERVVPQAHIVRVSDGQSHVDFPLRLFNVTTPLRRIHCSREGVKDRLG